MANDGGADAIMAAEDLRPLLNLSKRKAVGCAVALTKDKQAVLLLHRTMGPRKVMADLRKQAMAAKVDVDLQTLRFGRATVDGGSDSQCVHIAVNKEVPNAGNYELKLRERLKPAGFRRCRVTVDATLEGEPDDAADQPPGAWTKPSPPPVAGLPPQEITATPPPPSNTGVTGSATRPRAAAQDPVPAVAAVPPQDVAANADEWRPKARAALTVLAQQVASSTERDTPRRLELSGMADQANAAIKEGNQTDATTKMQALRQALGSAGDAVVTPTLGTSGTALPPQADSCPPSDYERGLTEAAETHRARTVASFQKQYDEARAHPFNSRVDSWEAEQNLEHARDAPLSHFVDSGMMDRGRMNAIQAGRQNMRDLGGFGPEAQEEACRRVQSIGPDSTAHGVLGMLGEGVDTVAPAAIGVLGSRGGIGAGPSGGRMPSYMRQPPPLPPARDGEILPPGQTMSLGRVQAQMPPNEPAWPQTITARPDRVPKGSAQATRPQGPWQVDAPPEVPHLPRRTAEQEVQALPGHGNARHGDRTTLPQQDHRLRTGMTPDGKFMPTNRATRFDSPEAQLDAVRRAITLQQAREKAGLVRDLAIRLRGPGSGEPAVLPRDRVVVTGYPGGYGSGFRRQGSGPGMRTVPTGQWPNARVVLERDPATGWRAVTQFPTNELPTPTPP